jgi:FHA domain
VTEQGVLPGLWPIHGDGVLARQGDLILLIHSGGGPFTDRLLGLLADAARVGDSGLRFTDLVSAEFDADAAGADTAGGMPGPAVVAFGPAGSGTAVAVYGTAWAEVTTAYGLQRLATGEPYGRLRCVLPSRLISVRAGVQPVADDRETDPYLRLADGIVRAVALVYAPEELAAALGLAAGTAADRGVAPDLSPAELSAGAQQPPAPQAPAQQAPAPQAPAQQAPAPQAPAEQAAPGPATPSPYADQVEEPEPEYRATRVEPAVPPRPVPPPPEPAVVQPPPAPEPVPVPPPPAPEPVYAPPAPEPAPARPPLPVDDPYAAQVQQPVPGSPDESPRGDFISVSLLGEAAGEVPQRDPLPLGAEPPQARDIGLVEMPPTIVEGVYCKNGHFNDPEARYCAVCGISMGQLTKIRQKGKRPPLGVLVLGDGSVCQLDADYVIGREPSLDSAVADGRARPLRLIGASGVVSRTHARVELDGWQVYISDLNSANGTQVLLPGERNAINLQPGGRTALVPGAQIRLGGEYGLQYDSHRHR